jgi:hypothetical protein
VAAIKLMSISRVDAARSAALRGLSNKNCLVARYAEIRTNGGLLARRFDSMDCRVKPGNDYPKSII